MLGDEFISGKVSNNKTYIFRNSSFTISLCLKELCSYCPVELAPSFFRESAPFHPRSLPVRPFLPPAPACENTRMEGREGKTPPKSVLFLGRRCVGGFFLLTDRPLSDIRTDGGDSKKKSSLCAKRQDGEELCKRRRRSDLIEAPG